METLVREKAALGFEERVGFGFEGFQPIVTPPGPAPTITSILPTEGEQDETLDVVITGEYFTNATGITFSGWEITVNSFTVDSDAQVTANITIDSEATPGAVDVKVTTPDGTGILEDCFTITAVEVTVELQPSSKDAYILEKYPTDNEGGATYIAIQDDVNAVERAIVSFDISSLPAGATIISAVVALFYWTYSYTDPQGKTIYFYKCTKPTWEELEATWNIYKASNNWAVAGGDYEASSPAGVSAIVPAFTGIGWIEADITAIVQDAIDNSIDVHLLVKFDDETLATGESAILSRSNNYYTDVTLNPKLTIVYRP